MKAYPLAADTFGAEEIAAAKAVLDSSRLTMGDEVRAFEQEFAAWVGAHHTVMVNSGSSANLLMVDSLLRRSTVEAPLRAGDEVLVPGLSWPTTVWPLVQLGLVPVFVDVDPKTLAIDLSSAAQAIGPATRGLALIHVLGRVPDMAAYTRFCKEHGLVLLEDCCESLGGHHDRRHVGRFGCCGTFSFFFSHHLSTIEGGMLVTDDAALADDLRSLRAHGWVRERSDKARWTAKHPELDERFLFLMPGYNVRPMELQAAIGRVQLKKLDAMLEARERLAARVQGWLARSAAWLKLLGSEALPRTPVASRRERTHSWMTLPLLLDEHAPLTLAQTKAKLEAAGVETRPIIAGNLARHPAAQRFARRSAPELGVCDALLTRGFMIGCHPVTTPAALEALEQAFAALPRS